MNKFSSEDRKYFSIGVGGYIGAGNNPLVFTRRPKPSFSRVRQIYGEHLEKLEHSGKSLKQGKKLSGELKSKFRAEIKRESIDGVRNRILAVLISLILFSILIWGAIKLIYLLIPYLTA